jgi:hypothetical protein
MTIYNPENFSCEITVEGVSYKIGPKESVDLKEAHGDYWLSIHQFLRAVNEKTAKQVEPVLEPDAKEPIAEEETVKTETKSKTKTKK